MSEESNLITIHVTLPSGEESKTIRVDKNCLVKSLKEAIQRETEIKIASQRLIYMGRILDNDLKHISDYGISDGSGIQLSLIVNKEEKRIVPKYESERKQLIDRIAAARTSQPMVLPIWSSILQLHGARYPDKIDTFDYPANTRLENFRQGLLTFNTYVSVLQVSPLFTPSLSSVHVSSTDSKPGYRCFFLGQWIDALDTVSKWLEATVIGISHEHVFVHYNGWPAVWDEWIHVNSPRLAPFRTHTAFVQVRSNSLPDVMTWSGSARPTGPDDSIMILQEISQAACSVWKSLSAFLDQYKEHRNAPDAGAWEEQRQQLYKQFAPLLDRVGRLTTDASQLLQFESAHEVMHQEEYHVSFPPVTTPVQTTSSTATATPMDSLVNTGLNTASGEPSVNMGMAFLSSLLMSQVDVPEPQQNQQQGQQNIPAVPMRNIQPIVIDIPADQNITPGVLRDYVEDAVRRATNQENQNEESTAEEPLTNVLSESVAPREDTTQPPRESLLKRLKRFGLLTKDVTVPDNAFNHNDEIDCIVCSNTHDILLLVLYNNHVQDEPR